MQNSLLKKGLVYGIVGLLITITALPVTGITVNKNVKSDEKQVIDEKNSIYNNYDTFSYSTSEKIDLETNFHPKEIIIKFKEETDISTSISSKNYVSTGILSIDALNEKYGVSSVEKIFEDFSITGLSSIYKFIFSNEVNIYHIIKKYSNDPSVQYAETNYIFQRNKIISNDPIMKLEKIELSKIDPSDPFLIPNDELFNQQWALNQLNDCDIDAPEAWYIETGSSDITIAIIDTGVDYNHVDLSDNIWNNIDEISNNGIDDDNNGFIDDTIGWDFVNNDNDPMDDNGYGTRCSGVAAAVTNNSIGIAGVSWNSQIMPIKGLDKDGEGFLYNLTKAIIYAVDNGADIICMGWGAYYYSKFLYNAISYAYDNGVVLVASAGYDNRDYEAIPASYNQVIAVAATNDTDKRADSSNYGDWIDIAAPGVNILSTDRGNNYRKKSGTSYSCSYVSGLAALLLSKHKQCLYPAQMVKSVICYTTDEIETDKYIGTGRINSYEALTMEPFAFDLESISIWEDVKDIVDIKGTIWGEELQYFILELGEGKNPNTWIELINSSEQQGGVLFSLDTTPFDEGLHTLRAYAVYDFGIFSKQTLMYINNQADGSYDADIYVSTCFDSSTPGWGVTHFSKIQEGIEKAKNDDTIFVHDGFYEENIDIIGEPLVNIQSISLIGQSKNWTIIEGDINISYAEKVTIKGFSIRGGTGILIDEYGIGYFGILLYYTSQCTIANNNIINYYNTNEILIAHSFKLIIRDNHFTSALSFSRYSQVPAILQSHTDESKIYNNTMIRTGFGVVLDNSFYNSVYKNKMLYCGTGVLIGYGEKNIIYKNIMSNNGYLSGGVEFWAEAFRNTIVANSFIDIVTGINGLTVEYGNSGNLIYYNNFERTPNTAPDPGRNIYYKPEGLFRGKGNYWFDYTGVDKNGDGIGDTPHVIENHIHHTKNIDRYPFMEPIDINNITIKGIEKLINEPADVVDQRSNSKCPVYLFFIFLEQFPILQKILLLQ
jgi:parallel beta-helix repeat protein